MKYFNRHTATILFSLFILPAALFLSGTALAQDKSSAESNMEILKEKLKGDKKLVIAENMTLTDQEAKGFWPIYEDYQKELGKLNERLKNMIERYAGAYSANTLTDETAKSLMDESIAIDEDTIQMRKNYAAKLATVLPGRKVARYMQIENKIRAVVRFALAAEIPLVD